MRTLALLVAFSLSLGAYSFGQFSFGSGSSMSAPENSGQAKGGGSGGGGRGSSSSPDLASSPGFCSDDIKSQKGENSLDGFMAQMDKLYGAGQSVTYNAMRADIVVLHSGFCPISGDGSRPGSAPQQQGGSGGGDQPITPTVIPETGGPPSEPPVDGSCLEPPC